MFAHHLEILKNELQKADDLSAVWDYFQSNLVEDPNFQCLGKEGKDGHLTEVIVRAGSSLLPSTMRFHGHWKMYHVPGYHFWHGTAEKDDHFVVFFYSEEEACGLAGVVQPDDWKTTKWFRFSTQIAYKMTGTGTRNSQ
jgi:hypothetical protein